MTSKQLKMLISAGVFSTALLSGTAYAKKTPKVEPVPTPEAPVVSTTTLPVPTTTQAVVPNGAKATTSKKEMADHGCAGANGCGGK